MIALLESQVAVLEQDDAALDASCKMLAAQSAVAIESRKD